MLYNLKYITGKLFCKHCSLIDIDSGALWILRCLAREFYKLTGKNLYVTSGARCPACNHRVGGRPGSAHKVIFKISKRSKAFDIYIKSNRDRYIILKILFEIGIKRLGIYRWGVHWDVGLGKNNYSQETCWI